MIGTRLSNAMNDQIKIEEEASSGKIAAELEMIGGDKSGLLMRDRELAARAYPPGTPLDPAAVPAA